MKFTGYEIMAEHEHKDHEQKGHDIKEHESKEHHAKSSSVTVKKSTVKLASFVIIALVVGAIIGYGTAMYTNPSSLPGSTAMKGSDSLAPQVGQKVVDYINSNIVQPGTSISLQSVEQTNGMYKINTVYQGQNISVYTDIGGNLLFLSSPLKTNETLPTQQQPTQAATAPKSDNPDISLYVMSFCPYGVQAEGAMQPVVDLLGAAAPVNVKFIVSITGNTTDSVQSLHGPTEAQEDLRQVCIMKYYDYQKYWAYVNQVDSTCYSNFRDATSLDSCWKAAAQNQSFDIQKIQSCATSQEGLALLAQDEQLTNANGVTGSPTLIINGVQYNGDRSPEAFKQAICGAFNNPPAECGTTVNSTVMAAAGNCGT